MSRFVLIASLSLSLGVAHADMFKPSKAEQVKLGQQAALEIRKKEKILPATDPRVIMLRRIGERLLKSVDDSKEPWKYSFDVVDSKEINAFALPGGPVFFFTGLLNKMKTEDELAGILGHELAHTRREHWAYAYA
ncbi:MAG: M48 family metalloprotease, partial [Fimbriimonadaceae bacterium]